jgi:membrane fusion protein, heavy metal efflux system
MIRLVSLLLCAAGLSLNSCAKVPDQAANSETPWRVSGSTVEYASKQSPPSIHVAAVGASSMQSVTVAGRLGWSEESTARVFPPVNGRVVRIEVEPGARVHRGQALLRMVSADFGQAQSDARRAAADREVAEHAYQRAQDLLTYGAVARKDFEQAEADWKRATAESARADARLRDAGEQGTVVNGGFELRSPLDGVVVERAVNAGTEVRNDSATPLFVISDPTKLTLLLDLPEALAASVRPDQEVTFKNSTLPGSGGTAHLNHLSLAVDPVTRTVRMRGPVISGHGAPLRSDAYVEAQLELNSMGALQVPADALVFVGGQQYLFIAEGNKFNRVLVSVGALGTDAAQITDGLRAGQTVVISGALYLEQLFESDSGT